MRSGWDLNIWHSMICLILVYLAANLRTFPEINSWYILPLYGGLNICFGETTVFEKIGMKTEICREEQSRRRRVNLMIRRSQSRSQAWDDIGARGNELPVSGGHLRQYQPIRGQHWWAHQITKNQDIQSGFRDLWWPFQRWNQMRPTTILLMFVFTADKY